MSNTADIEKESKPNQPDNAPEAAASEIAAGAITKKAQDEPAAMTAVEEITDEPTLDIPQETPQPAAHEQLEQENLPENVRILKEAFPETDLEVIEAVLQTQNDNVESSFEILLGMSDPNYSAPSAPAPAVVEQAPPMPPRPQQRQNSTEAPYTYWERQAQPEPTTVEEQLRMDEELAKKLALEDERNSQQRRRSSQQSQQQQQPQRRRSQSQDDDDDDSIFNLQEELPIIKEKMKEAGNAAKKKMMDLYNQFKANTQKNNSQNQNEHVAASSMPTTNAQYRGLPSDDGDDLLTGDISALHLSDYDVYAKTNGRPRKSNDYQNNRGEDVIYVNPPVGSPAKNTNSIGQTSTSDAQLRADEDFARQLAEEEQMEARRSRNSSMAQEDNTLHAPQMPTRKPVSPTVVIAPRSPLEFEGDSDYEDIGLTAASPLTNNTAKRNNATSNNTLEENTSVPYVIGDDDDSDSDSDDLVDIDDDEFKYEDDDKPVEEKEESEIKDSTTATATTTSKDDVPSAKELSSTADAAELKSTVDNTKTSITH